MSGRGTPFGASDPTADRSANAYELGLVLGPKGARVSLAGEIDLSAAADLTRLMKSLMPLSMPIDLDLGAVSFLDSNGLAPLFEACRQRGPGQPPITIVACSARARRLLELFGIEASILDVKAWDLLAAELGGRQLFEVV